MIIWFSVVLQMPSGKMFTMSGGGFDPNRYKALQLHFHWSPTGSTEGSEHTIDGKQYPLEVMPGFYKYLLVSRVILQ